MNVARGSCALAWRQKWIRQPSITRIFLLTAIYLGLLHLLLATEADAAGLLFDLLFKLLHFEAKSAEGLTLHLFGNGS